MSRHKNPFPPECHPDRVYFAKNLCKPCYNRIDKRIRKDKLLEKRGTAAYRVWNFNNKNRLSNLLTILAYEDLYSASQGLCYICGASTDLVIDHDHKTDLIRGLLCKHCNWGLGQFKDDLDLLFNAIDYLRNPRPVFKEGVK